MLQVGCGNSRFADDLHDNGIRDVTSIDVVPGVIAAQRSKAGLRKGLQFEVMDVTEVGSMLASVWLATLLLVFG